jgi:signal transduction histidine kinase
VSPGCQHWIVSVEALTPLESTGSRRRLLAHALFGVTLLAIGAGIVLTALDVRQRPGASNVLDDWGFIVAFVAFPIVGYVLASRRPDNAVSWVMFGSGVALGIDALLNSYAGYAIHGGAGGIALGRWAAGLSSPMWLPIVALPATFLFLLFPDGHLPSSRWRWFAWLLAASLGIVFLAILLSPGTLEDSGYPNVTNPFGVRALRNVLAFSLVLLVVLPVGVIAALVSLVQRYRRSSGIERLQLRWLVVAASIVGVLYALSFLVSFSSDWLTSSTPSAVEVVQTAAILSFALVPLTIGVSVLRYKLLEIDVVINRAVLFGALAVFITAVYVAIVVGIGAAVGNRANPLLSAAAAAVVALAFQPVRRRAQRLANRLVYGKRATPYEVLSEFADRLGTTYAGDELLPKIARALAEGTGAARAEIWVRVGDQLRVEAGWPEGVEVPVAVPASERTERSVTPSTIFEPVRHRGEFLGAVAIAKKPGDSVTATEERLVHDVAAQAGLVLRNVALTEELLENIEQLRASRQRLVAAQDDERRKLERNIHDGAQQQLVALTVKLGLLQQLVDRDAGKAKSLAADLQAEATAALDDLRDLARGIYPPLLADQGLVVALRSQARRSTVPLTVEGDHVGRYPRDAEAAIYFACLEALQNISKYAQASRASVRLFENDGRLHFEVTDDGIGFDPGVASYGTGLQGIADRRRRRGRGCLPVESRRRSDGQRKCSGRIEGGCMS